MLRRVSDNSTPGTQVCSYAPRLLPRRIPSPHPSSPFSPRTTSTGDMSRVDELYRTSTCRVSSHLRFTPGRGNDLMLAGSPTCLVRSSRAYIEEAHPSSLTRAPVALPFERSPTTVAPHRRRSPRGARYPTSKVLPSLGALRPIARSEVGSDDAFLPAKHTRERWDAAALVRCCAFANEVPFFLACHHHLPPFFLCILALFPRIGSRSSERAVFWLGESLPLFLWLFSSVYRPWRRAHTHALPDAGYCLWLVSHSESLSVTMSLLTLVSSHLISSHLSPLYLCCPILAIIRSR